MTDFREVIDIVGAEIGRWEGAALVVVTTLSLVMLFAAMVAALPGLRRRDAPTLIDGRQDIVPVKPSRHRSAHRG